MKYAILCRVLCGVPGDDPDDDQKDCIIMEAALELAGRGQSGLISLLDV